MRNAFLAIAIAFVVAAPCTVASAQSYQSYVKTEASKQGKGDTPPTTSGGTTRRDISSGQAAGKRQWAPALTTQGTVGGSTGPTKPTLPTTGRLHQ
jgi:hypothetical protein